MRDLYKELKLAPDAPDAEIQGAVGVASAPAPRAASAILLNDRRRPVYDRNHRLLTTIARMRGRLGVTLSPFWARGNFADFTEEPPKAPSETVVPQGAIDSLIINRAFARGGHRSRRMRSLRNREILLATAGGVLSLIFLALVVFVIKMTT